MAHNRKLVLGGVSLTMGRTNRYDIEVMGEVRDDLEEVMISSGYLDNAPFKWVGLILRYGLKIFRLADFRINGARKKQSCVNQVSPLKTAVEILGGIVR